jgi:queuosine biosynthesis protein QueD
VNKHHIEIDVHFSAGHRIIGHMGKCRHLHGHSYTARVRVSAKVPDKLDMVLDFSQIKGFVKKWVEDNWDHNMILCILDPLNYAFNNYKVLYDGFGGDEIRVNEILGEKQPYIMPKRYNPTAERMAEELYNIVDEWLESMIDKRNISDNREVSVESVSIKEEEGSWATYKV